MKIRYTIPALADLTSILDHIATHSPQGAKRAQRRIHDVVELLASHSDIGVRTEDPVIRRLTAPPYPYVVFYEVTEAEIVVHAVRHTARNPSGMPGSV